MRRRSGGVMATLRRTVRKAPRASRLAEPVRRALRSDCFTAAKPYLRIWSSYSCSAGSSSRSPAATAISWRRNRSASRSAVLAPIPAIGVMLWIASPSSVTRWVGQAPTGVALRTRTALTVCGSEPPMSSRSPGAQSAVPSSTTRNRSAPPKVAVPAGNWDAASAYAQKLYAVVLSSRKSWGAESETMALRSGCQRAVNRKPRPVGMTMLASSRRTRGSSAVQAVLTGDGEDAGVDPLGVRE
jgi:hypothetical protein